MQAFHNDPRIKADLIAQLEAHYAADEIVKGKYWENGKGCAVGCCIHGDDHRLFPSLFGIPESIAHLMDGIFEGLPNEQAKEFPLSGINSIQVGADLTKVENLFIEWLLIDPTHGINRFNSNPCIPAVAALHRRVVNGGPVSSEEWTSARNDAAVYAAYAAAAYGAAVYAAYASYAAAAYATAAREAAREAQSQKLIELLAAAPVFGAQEI